MYAPDIGLDFPDFEYGRRILRTKSGKYLALMVCNDDKVMEEFSSVLRRIAGSSSSQRIASIFNKTFGIARDAIAGESIDASLKHTVPSRNGLSNAHHLPLLAVDLDQRHHPLRNASGNRQDCNMICSARALRNRNRSSYFLPEACGDSG